MDIKVCGREINNVRNGTVTLNSGDTLSVGYTDPHGKFHLLNISAQHLVLMVAHEPSEAAMVFRPAVGVQFVEPAK